jgi:hypothetical protein
MSVRRGQIRLDLIEKERRSDIPLHVPPIAPEDSLLFQRDENGNPRVFLISRTDGEEGRAVEILFDPRHVQHSPDGFEWGYGGSGPPSWPAIWRTAWLVTSNCLATSGTNWTTTR